jgi:DNA polymerase I-like protein with 3'-5' exonuclease and polymerase domains
MPTLERWARVEPFNPVSSDQIKAYCQFKGYEIPLNRKPDKNGIKQPTTNEEAIETILRKNGSDKVLEMGLEARHLSKALGYLNGNYIGRDGKFHPIFTFRPTTGRLSAVRPNIQNQPNHGVDAELAMAIRRCVIPSKKGRVLLECDWKACEAVLTGYFADDPDYILISKKDSHSYFASFILREEGKINEEIPKPTDPGIDAFLTRIKKCFPDERFMAKIVNLATGYNMQWRHLSELLRCDAATAKKYLRLKAEMAPKVNAWKEATWMEAHRKGYLETPFGYRNYFWNVLEPVKGKPGMFRAGKEANEALAFRPQSSGASMLREAMLDVDKYDGRLFDFLAPIHDAILVECEEKDVRESKEIICESMARPWPELGGLAIEAEAKWSKTSWADMVDFK